MDEWTAPNQKGKPGYEGYLNDRVATLPQLLRDAGYHTYMVGKWHMGKQPDQIPAARGFERDFTLLDGAGSYWDMNNLTGATPTSTFTEDGRYPKSLPKVASLPSAASRAQALVTALRTPHSPCRRGPLARAQQRDPSRFDRRTPRRGPRWPGRRRRSCPDTR